MIPNASELQLGILAESVWGVLPSPATFQAIRVTGESLEIRRDNIVSQEIRADRNVSDLIQVGGSAGGSINFELSNQTFDDLIASALFSTWTGSPANTIVNGVTPKSFHIQKKLEAGATDQYFLYKGMMVDTMDLAIRLKQIVTGSFSFVGKNGVLSQTATGTTTAANANAVLNAASHLTLTQVAVSPVPTILGLNLRVSNKLREQGQCSSVEAAGIGAGRCEVSGSIEAYFSSNAMVDLFLAGTGGGLNFVVGAATNAKYRIQIPSLKFSTARVVAGGNDQDMVVAADFQGLYNAGIAATIKIERGVA